MKTLTKCRILKFSFTVASIFLMLLPVVPGFAQSTTWFSNKTSDAGLSNVKATHIYSADINNDNYPDLILLKGNKYEKAPIQVLLNGYDTASGNQQKRKFFDITSASNINQSSYKDSIGRRTHLLALADLNNDGNIDVVTGLFYRTTEEYTDNTDRCEVLMGDGKGHFQMLPANGLHELGLINATSFSFIDYNKDGKIDLFISRWYPDYNNLPGFLSSGILMQGKGDGTFTEVTNPSGVVTMREPMNSCTVTDWNNDGWPDILTSPYENSNGFLMKNNGNGTFSNVTAAAKYNARYLKGDSSMNMVMRGIYPYDYDNDEDMDLLFLFFNGGNAVGEGRTTIVTNSGSQDNDTLSWDLTRIKRDIPKSTRHGDFDASWFDMDNDGMADIVMAQGGVITNQDRTYFFKQNVNKYFDDVTLELGLQNTDLKSTQNVEVLDYDLDGDDDVLISKYDEQNRVVFLQNDIGSTNKWISIKLKAPAAVNKSCIGAKICIYVANKVQTKEIYAGRGYLAGQQPFIINFGIGTKTKIDSVEVFWPSNPVLRTVVTNPTLNKLTELCEWGYTSINNTSDNQTPEITVYPVPTRQQVNINLQGNTTRIKTIIMSDITGRLLQTKSGNQVSSKTNFDISMLQSGCYLLRIELSNGMIVNKKFLKSE
jgi:hypothetical protein